MKLALTLCKPNTTAVVVGFLALDAATLRRLGSFGVCLAAPVQLVRFSLFKQTLLLEVGGHQFAMHRSVASGILVEKAP